MATLKKREAFKSRGCSFKEYNGSAFVFTDDKPLNNLEPPAYRISFPDGVMIYADEIEVYETVE